METKNPLILKGYQWPEPLRIDYIEELGDYIRLVGEMTLSHQHVDQILTKNEFISLQKGEIKTTFSADPKDYFLALEARRYRLASLYDPLLAMNTSKVDPLPHQIDAVYGYVLKLPRIRFLIADDPGAGKTIMAGLIIKELKLRGLAKRILIVVPGHLKDQWRREMKERFEENFIVIDRGFMDAFYGENPWERENQIITSMDFAKQEEIIPSITSSHYDLIVVDEAHKMSAFRYGDKLDKTVRYRLGERLSESCIHLLFLTATPHRGDPENFRLFLDLLEPGFFATTEMVSESIRNQDNPLFIRRIKEDLRDFDGKPLFLPRKVKTIGFNLGVESHAEKDLYNALSRYVNEQFNKALNTNLRRNVAFALVILQRRLASSTYALLCSLERRKKRLKEILDYAEQKQNVGRDFDFNEIEEMSEAERWKQEEYWETLSVADNRQELKEEIHILEQLIDQARKIVLTSPPTEAKLKHFKDAIDQLNQDYPGEKILVFTESRDTLEYLERNLNSWGYSVCTIHGGMGLEERIHAEAIFKQDSQIMVATEAAGEGINLQFCHLMINYDIPWNPNRLEQRMGRIHRYGQTREVFVFNLVAIDTREGQVLNALFNKLEEIRNALGTDKVFDVLGGDPLPGKNLSQLLIDAATNARNIDDILREIEITIDSSYLDQVRSELGESLATRFIDYTRIHEMAEQAREHRLIPEYTQAFFQQGIEKMGGTLTPRKMAQCPEGRFFSLEHVPSQLRKIGEEENFKKQFGTILKRYSLITFDKDLAMRHPQAELVTFGDPLFEALMLWVERNLQTTLTEGTIFLDPEGRMNGTIFFYQGEIRDGKNEIAGTRLFALFADQERGSITPINPTILWDLQKDSNLHVPPSPVSLEELKNRALTNLIGELEAYRNALLEERSRQAEIKQKYGVQSLKYLINKLDADLVELYIRRDNGENVDLVIRNKEEQKNRYERALEELQGMLEQERQLTLSTPVFLGAARIVPAAQPDDSMSSDPEIERLAMQIAMAYERENGRQPEDVSFENLGYDIRSTSAQGRNFYIEVKGRAGSGAVALTKNEWFMAQRFGDAYYLYVVFDVTHQPKLYRIQNPAKTLESEERVDVRYWVPLNEITLKGELS